MSPNRLPSNLEKRIDWINAIQKHQIFDDKSQNVSVCNLHFDREHFTPRRKLVDNAIPTVFNIYEVEEIDAENRSVIKNNISIDGEIGEAHAHCTFNFKH